MDVLRLFSSTPNQSLFTSLTLFFFSILVIARWVPPYLFAICVILGYFFYQRHTQQVSTHQNDQTKYSTWIQPFPYKQKKALLEYPLLLDPLFQLRQRCQEKDTFHESIRHWIQFCHQHHQFVQGKLTLTSPFIEHLFDLQRQAMSLLLLLRYQLKPSPALDEFDTLLSTLYHHSRSMLSEIISNSPFTADEFDITPLNPWDTKESQDHWKLL